jgi:undecaprenyl-diphosphatase
VALVTGSLALFAEAADDHREEDGRRSDWLILEAMRADGDPSKPAASEVITQAAKGFSALGSIPVLAGVTAIASAYFASRGHPKTAVRMLGALLGGIVLSEVLKDIYNRGRPPLEYRLVKSENEAFPSGHALLSTTVYVMLATFAARSFKRTSAKVATIGAALATAFGAGAARVYLGVHWANDVVAGWSIGAAWGAAWWLGHKPTR